MGSHYYADGAMHEEVKRIGGNVTHISRMWNYADAVRHPKPRRPGHGLKLIPPRSGLVLDPTGKRYGPIPLIPTFDAYYALERMLEDPRGYYWMVCNWKIARRELDVSGAEHNPQIREKRLIRFLLSVLLGKPTLVRYFIEQCPDFVAADSLPELTRKMQAVTADDALDPALVEQEVSHYDAAIDRGRPLFNDDQLRRIQSLRNWRGDRLRTASKPIWSPGFSDRMGDRSPAYTPRARQRDSAVAACTASARLRAPSSAVVCSAAAWPRSRSPALARVHRALTAP
jgi:predicted oxidoreductase